MITGDDIIKFRNEVSKDVASQHPLTDYLAGNVARSIEKHSRLLGFEWYHDGPRPIEKSEVMKK